MLNTLGIEETDDGQYLIPFTGDEVTSLSEAISFLKRNNYKKIEDIGTAHEKLVTALYMENLWIDSLFND